MAGDRALIPKIGGARTNLAGSEHTHGFGLLAPVLNETERLVQCNKNMAQYVTS